MMSAFDIKMDQQQQQHHQNTQNQLWNIMNNSLSARAKHFSSLERRTLMRLVRMHSDVLDDKRLNKDVNAYKIKCWDRIAEIYNATPGFAYRDKLQLKKCWENIKFRIKKGDLGFEESFYNEMELMDTEAPNSDSNFGSNSNIVPPPHYNMDPILIKDEESNEDDTCLNTTSSFYHFTSASSQQVPSTELLNNTTTKDIMPSASLPRLLAVSSASRSNDIIRTPSSQESYDQPNGCRINSPLESSRLLDHRTSEHPDQTVREERKRKNLFYARQFGRKQKKTLGDLTRREQLLKIQLLNDEIKQSAEQHTAKMRILQTQCDLLEMQKSRFANGLVNGSIDSIFKI